MKPNFFLLIFLFSTSFCLAQFEDDFSNDLSNWSGDVDNFTINGDQVLQLNAPDAGTSLIYTQVDLADSLFWELYFKLDFSPSGSNQLRIYLQADNQDLLNANGYFLEVGETGSDDALHFYRQDAGSETLLTSATIGALGSSPAEARIRMERDFDGTWRLFADYSSGSNFEEEFTILDNTYASDNNLFFGLICSYTATRTDKFFFDDINIQELLPDLDPPTLISATPILDTQVDVFFDENLSVSSAENINNYSINNGIGNPSTASLDPIDLKLVHLTLSNPLANFTDYTLTATGEDLAGNISSEQSVDFNFFQPLEAEPLDILINEIMADPTPQVGLPEVEYIELYNRSDKVIDLENFGFSNGGSPKLLPSYQLLPDSYVLLCDEDAQDSLAQYGDLVLLPVFPALSNNGDDLSLYNQFGELIHFVNYSRDWYGDNARSDGGYSLELISPFNICEGQDNWFASQNILGGTPGAENSIFDNSPDEKNPDLLHAYVSRSNPTEVQLFFSEILDLEASEDLNNYAINNNVEIIDATLVFPESNVVKLQLATPLEALVDYEISIKSELTDCNGNPIGLFNTATFALPIEIEPGDIKINEILFDPEPDGVDFIELYNGTNKTFDLSELLIGNIYELGNISNAVVIPVTTKFLFRPQTYLALSPNPTDIKNRYTVENPDWLLQSDLPGFSNDFGNVSVLKSEILAPVYIDSFTYSVDYHHPLLDDEEGVSLERINPSAPSQDPGNWHSAAREIGYATPTFKNSQQITESAASDDMFTLINPTFSPDGDGYKDFLQIAYTADQNGYVANIQIFDAAGRKVRTLVSNELLGTEGSLKWDGSLDDQTKANIGIYILWIELFTPSGDVKEIKKTCVVAAQLD